MTDASQGHERPRPQYGEYATPEEQRAHIRDPQAASVYSPVADAAVPPAAVPPAAPSVPPRVDPQGPVLRPHPADRIATIALLVYGAINVVFTAVSFLDLPTVAERAMQIMGIPGDFTNVESARSWGLIAAILLAVGYVVTALLAVRRLRSGRLAWWIPLVGALVTYAIVYVCIAIPLLGDPAFSQYITNPPAG
ncbi:DUF6264 family protein [Microbacterium immunditiarum]|uniref:Uncharacterized membrane protein YhaH (DUF805 family) n=1 Tax=Microbacterium immunditiarum TaxID=337480 RepID=A0A7Y9GNN1_9MICO|nr:DUF6264 family protein [Microbacterium immunditiarum]NYE19843.1 uncharacterized membrane protein YhaH (DUF805 family) [Microbacterium immunditiarum]